MDINYLQIFSAVFVGLASGYLGSFMVLKRMALVGDALSHVALPGVALALLFNINPFLGAFATLFAGIIGIWLVEHKTELPVESVVGLFFTISLAVGVLITPDERLVEALFGDISKVSTLDVFLAITFSVVIIFVMKSISKGFVLGTISKDLAQSNGVNLAKINFLFLILVALVVSLGIKSIGTLLMGALVIIPAIASKNISLGMRHYTARAAIIGLVSMVGGIIVASALNLSPGPLVVLTSAGIFLVTLAFKK